MNKNIAEEFKELVKLHSPQTGEFVQQELDFGIEQFKFEVDPSKNKFRNKTVKSRMLKFKIWDSKTRTFIKPYGIGIVDRKWFDTHGDNVKTDLLTVFSDDADVCQFTGILDKDGTEIYEGDKISFQKNNFSVEIGTVQYQPSSARFIIYYQDIFFTEFGDNIENIKVVGNIYQNLY